MKNLAQQINELNENLAQQLPTEIMTVFGESIHALKMQGLETSSIGIGDVFPDFILRNTKNEKVALSELLKQGKVIIAFFRGSWCPYCNLELKALQEHLQGLTAKQATLVAISPQASGYNEQLQQAHQLAFDVLTDQNNRLAKQIGIAFHLDDAVLPVYASLGISLAEYNENEQNELPIPAVFVLDTTGHITFKFADTNYMNRVDIQEVIKQL